MSQTRKSQFSEYIIIILIFYRLIGGALAGALDIIKNIKSVHSGANITASLRQIRNKTTSSLQNFFA